MCLGIPGQVVELLGDQPDLAQVEVSGVRRAINLGLLADEAIAPGDWILIHMGFALSRIDEQEAKNAMAFLEGINEAYDDELTALRAAMFDTDDAQAADEAVPAGAETEGS